MIEFRNVSQSYKDHKVLTDINMTIQSGEFVVLIGSSGCGKTTLLKTINKLTSLAGGDLLIDGVSIRDIPDIALRRRIGYVIQDGGLFPHLTVEENISLLLETVGMPSEKIPARVDEVLEMVNLDPDTFRNSFPAQLSGGQKQRVGVARAFSANPDIILMDEPFSALDPVTRGELQNEVVKLQKRFHKTIVFVTHDMDEAIKMADRICIIQNGQIAQFDRPEEILKRPANAYVEEFGQEPAVGQSGLYPCRGHHEKGCDPYFQEPHCSAGTADHAAQYGGFAAGDQRTGTPSGGHCLAEEPAGGKGLFCIAADKHPRARCRNPHISLQEIIDTVDYDASGIIPVVNHENELLGGLTKSGLLATLSKRYRRDSTEGAEE